MNIKDYTHLLPANVCFAPEPDMGVLITLRDGTGIDIYPNYDENGAFLSFEKVHNTDNQEQEYTKRRNILEKIIDGGGARYNSDPLLRNVIESLLRGADSWEIIGKLIQMNDELTRKFKILLTKWPSKDYPDMGIKS